jgi:hypothetical protein
MNRLSKASTGILSLEFPCAAAVRQRVPKGRISTSSQAGPRRGRLLGLSGSGRSRHWIVRTSKYSRGDSRIPSPRPRLISLGSKRRLSTGASLLVLAAVFFLRLLFLVLRLRWNRNLLSSSLQEGPSGFVKREKLFPMRATQTQLPTAKRDALARLKKKCSRLLRDPALQGEDFQPRVTKVHAGHNEEK